MITGEQKQEYLDFFNDIFGIKVKKEEVKLIAKIDEEGKPNLVVVFCNCDDKSVEILIAKNDKDRLSKGFIEECVKYIFVTCGFEMVFCYAEISNAKSNRLIKRMCFDRENDEPLSIESPWFGQVVCNKYVMLKENCKWIERML
jgi:hypothetical protein